jgi:hypothetical protein
MHQVGQRGGHARDLLPVRSEINGLFAPASGAERKRGLKKIEPLAIAGAEVTQSRQAPDRFGL